MQADAAQSDSFVRFLAWVQVHQKRLILWGGIAVAAITILCFFVYYQRQQDVRASMAFANVASTVNPAQPPPPGTAEAYLKVAREHGGTRAGSFALMNGGTALFIEGKYAEAQNVFEQFVREYPESPFIASAHYGIASALDVQGKIPEAIAKFEEVQRRFGSDPIIDDVKLALGRLYETQNRPADAHRLYSDVLRSHESNPYSGYGNEAGARKVDLEAKFPELARTNAPIMAPSAASLVPQMTSALTNAPGRTSAPAASPGSATTAGAATNTTGGTTNVSLLIQPAPATPSQTNKP